jgi:hypothetical protein
MPRGAMLLPQTQAVAHPHQAKLPDDGIDELVRFGTTLTIESQAEEK